MSKSIMNSFCLFLCVVSSFFVTIHSQVERYTEPQPDYSKWTVLAPGVEYKESVAPIKSYLGDSKLSVLRLDPKRVEADFFMATKHKTKSLNAYQWADSFRLNIVCNASMYELGKPLQSRGYLRAGGHANNAVFRENYRSAIVTNPKDTSEVNLQILDLTCESWVRVQKEYDGIAQGLRMISCNGTAMSWNKRNQSCSMLVAAQDKKGWFYLIFTRSPYTHNEMIRFLKEMPEGIRNTIYLEGGPETSLLIDVNGHCIEKVGSWVSDTYERDDNYNFWRLPNVLGIKVKP